MYFNSKREKWKNKKKTEKGKPHKCSAGSPMQLDKKMNREADREISERGSGRQLDDVAHVSGHMQ